jgi:hypothetical protein
MSHLAIITPLPDKLKATMMWSLDFKEYKLAYYMGEGHFLQASAVAF